MYIGLIVISLATFWLTYLNAWKMVKFMVRLIFAGLTTPRFKFDGNWCEIRVGGNLLSLPRMVVAGRVKVAATWHGPDGERHLALLTAYDETTKETSIIGLPLQMPSGCRLTLSLGRQTHIFTDSVSLIEEGADQQN